MTQKYIYWRLFLLLFVQGLCAEPLFFDNSNLLAEHGFENIWFSSRDDGDIAVYYENRVYRDELYAAGVVMALIDPELADSVNVSLIPSRRALPICELRIDRSAYKGFVALPEASMPDTAFVSVGDVKVSSPFRRRHFERPSFGKIDLTVYPTFSVYLGNYDDRFKLFFAMMPVASTTLWKGASAYVEMSVPMYNDVNYQYFRFIDYPQLSKAAMNQIVRLPFHIMASASFGLYNPNRWGWGGEVNKSFFNRRFSLGYSFEYTGFLLYYDHVWHYSKKDLLTSKAYALYYSDFLNCQFGLSYNRYVMKDSGWLFEFSRNFRESTLGIFAGSTPIDKFGGIALRFPIGRFKKKRPGIVRLRLPRYYEYSYRATNKVYTQHSPVQTGISVYTGTKLAYLDLHLTPNYVANNLQRFHDAYKSIYTEEEGSGEEEFLLFKTNK
jgi:hypothetical protein